MVWRWMISLNILTVFTECRWEKGYEKVIALQGAKTSEILNRSFERSLEALPLKGGGAKWQSYVGEFSLSTWNRSSFIRSSKMFQKSCSRPKIWPFTKECCMLHSACLCPKCVEFAIIKLHLHLKSGKDMSQEKRTQARLSRCLFTT